MVVAAERVCLLFNNDEFESMIFSIALTRNICTMKFFTPVSLVSCGNGEEQIRRSSLPSFT